MTTLMRWGRDPFFSQLANLQQDLNRRFDHFMGDGQQQDWRSTFAPPLDIKEDENHYVIALEVPGINPDDIDISLTGNTLVLRGEKRQEEEQKNENWHRVERTYGAFTRTVELPAGIDAEKVSADYDHGVLTVSVAKAEEVKPRQIKVRQGK